VSATLPPPDPSAASPADPLHGPPRGHGDATADAIERLTVLEQQLALLGHNLRNPLNAIAAAVEVLNRSAADTRRAVRAREVISMQTERLAAIVNRFASQTCESSTDFEAVVDLAEIVGNVVGVLRRRLVAERRSIHASLSAGLVPGRREVLDACVDRLLNRTLELMPSGGVLHLQVRACGTLVELTMRHRTQAGETEMPDQVRYDAVQLPRAARLHLDDDRHCLRFSLPAGRIA